MQLRVSGALACLASLLCAVIPSSAASQTGPTQHFVVLNLAGPNFVSSQSDPELYKAHRDIYRDFEAQCLTLVGGALRGDSVLGITIFRTGVDEADIRAKVEADPAVTSGSLTLDYRHFQIHMGEIPSSRADCQPGERAADAPL